MSSHQADVEHSKRRLSLVTVGLSLSFTSVISYLFCIALGLIWWEGALHQPWLQFLPGFVWLTWGGFFIGLAESFAYGWYFALIFTPLYNVFSSRFG